MFSRSRRGIIALLCVFTCILFYLAMKDLPGGFNSNDFRQNPIQYEYQNNVTVDAVVVKLRKENARWLPRFFPDWNHKIYIVDDAKAPLTVAKNKGRESMAYLTYIIDNYDALPEFVLFLHSQRFQWHNDDPDYDGFAMLRRLRFQHVKDEGYVSLRCAWVLGCPYEIRPFADLHLPGDTKAPNRAYKQAFQELFPGVEVPNTVGTPCCAQFAVSRERILTRPKSDFVRWRDWLADTELSDYVSGRIMEYSWHMIFGKRAQYCPNAATCYCKLYGLCDLTCSESNCDGRYLLPTYSNLPDGWPRFERNGSARAFNGPD